MPGRRARPGKNRAGGLAATVAGLALLAVAGCSSGGSAHPASVGGSTPASGGAAAGPPSGLQAPATIGSLKKAADQSPAKLALEGFSPSLRKQGVAVDYQDGAADTHVVAVVGFMEYPIESTGSADKVKRILASYIVGVKVSSATSVGTGSAGGSAECAPEPPAKDIACGWVNGKAAITVNFHDIEQSRVHALMPQILSAVVRT
jgi:hypothetical protein